MQKNSICSWSGGKDSCFALMKSLLTGHSLKILLNVLNEEGKISRSHGIPSNILQAQAQRSGLPIQLISSTWKDYEEKFTSALLLLKKEFNLTHAVFGDIDLQAHRDWEEMVCQKAGLIAVLPLWKQERRSLVYQMLESGIETIIVSCNEKMGERFLGQIITPALVDELEAMNIDPCGENGEYHTLVLDCPLFDERINVRVLNNLRFDNYWFSELELITG